MRDKPRILLLASDSLDLFYIPISKEQRSIEDRIRASSHGDRFEVISRPSMKLPEFGEELMRFDPQVVHLSAEGRSGEGILLEDEAGNGKAVGAHEMAGLIRELKGSIRLMFLNACHTQEHAEAISKEVDYVIGMNGKVEEETAMAFARHFYQALGYGKTVEKSVQSSD